MKFKDLRFELDMLGLSYTPQTPLLYLNNFILQCFQGPKPKQEMRDKDAKYL